MHPPPARHAGLHPAAPSLCPGPHCAPGPAPFHTPQTLHVEWPGKGGLSLVVRAPLSRAEPAQPVIASMLSLLLDNLAALKALAEQQQRQLGAFEKQVGAGACSRRALQLGAGMGGLAWGCAWGLRQGHGSPERDGLSTSSTVLPATGAAAAAVLRPQAERSQDLIDRYVNTKAQQDKETNAKVDWLAGWLG